MSKDKLTELKPCPFCGSDFVIMVRNHKCTVECRDCMANGPVKDLIEDAKNGWNRRPNGVANNNFDGDHSEFVRKLYEVRMEPDKLLILVQLEKQKIDRAAIKGDE